MVDVVAAAVTADHLAAVVSDLEDVEVVVEEETEVVDHLSVAAVTVEAIVEVLLNVAAIEVASVEDAAEGTSEVEEEEEEVVEVEEALKAQVSIYNDFCDKTNDHTGPRFNPRDQPEWYNERQVPAPNAQVTQLEINIETSLATQDLSQLTLSNRAPVRPGYGTKGQAVTLWVD